MTQYYSSQKKNGTDRDGFTLVETLVAVTILLITIIGPMTIASRGIQSALFAGDQTTAIYLAQEAVEHIQSLRDDVALEEFQDGENSGDTGTWFSSGSGNFSNYCRTVNNNEGCDIDLETGNYLNCGNASNCRLHIYDPETPDPNEVRTYGYGSGASWTTESPYTRTIRIGEPVDANGTRIGGVPVTVTVSWDATLFGGDTKVVTLQTYVYDYYTRYE